MEDSRFLGWYGALFKECTRLLAMSCDATQLKERGYLHVEDDVAGFLGPGWHIMLATSCDAI
jgi:hypothetical protein